jgi:lysozyme family protein
MNFDEAFHELLGHEGGYVDHIRDPGGATRWGVTQRVAREHGYTGDMREFPVEMAKMIYRASYWDAVRADELPKPLRYATFDAAVNSGVTQAAKWLQRAVGAVDDGKIGPETIRMANGPNPEAAARRMLGARLRFMTELHTWPAFGRGWSKRIASLLEAA